MVRRVFFCASRSHLLLLLFICCHRYYSPFSMVVSVAYYIFYPVSRPSFRKLLRNVRDKIDLGTTATGGWWWKHSTNGNSFTCITATTVQHVLTPIRSFSSTTHFFWWFLWIFCRALDELREDNGCEWRNLPCTVCTHAFTLLYVAINKSTATTLSLAKSATPLAAV